MSVKQRIFKRAADLRSQSFTYLDHLSKLLKIAAVIDIEYKIQTNLIQNKFYRRYSTKGTEQCSLLKRLSTVGA